MVEFLLHLGWLNLSMSLVILLALLWGQVSKKRFSAKSRYQIWSVVILSLCVGVGLFRLPALLTVEVPSFVGDVLQPTEHMSGNAEYTPSASETTPNRVETADAPLGNQGSATDALPSFDATLSEGDAPTVTPSQGGTQTFPTTPNTHEGIQSSPTPSIPPQEIEPATPTPPAQEGVLPESPSFDLVSGIFALWSIGTVLFFGINLAVYLRSTRKLGRKKQLCDAQTQAIFRALCQKYEIKRTPRLYLCEDIGSPILYGYIAPTVLLPTLKLSKNAAVGVLAHELTHYRRGDLGIKLACTLAEALYWFNPLVHLAAARCNAEMELSCDEAVLSGLEENARRSYGGVMLEIVRNCSRRRSMLTTQFNPHKTAVKERMMNILDMKKKKRGKVILAAALILCIVLGVVVGCDIKNKNDPTQNGSTVDEAVYEDARLVTEQLIKFVMQKDWLEGIEHCSDENVSRFLTSIGYYVSKEEAAHPYYELVTYSEDHTKFLLTAENAQKIASRLFAKDDFQAASYLSEVFDETANTYQIPSEIGLYTTAFFPASMNVSHRGNTVYVECGIKNSEWYEDTEDIDYGTYTFSYEYIAEEDGAYLRFAGVTATKANTVLYRVADGITSIDRDTFSGIDEGLICELTIGKDVKHIDLAYLNTFPALKRITVDEENAYYHSHIHKSGASILISRTTNEMLYLPAEYGFHLYEDEIPATLLDPSTNVTVYICGGVLETRFTTDGLGTNWYLKSAEYGDIRKVIEYNMPITVMYGLNVFRFNEGLCIAYCYSNWSNAIIFHEHDRLYEFKGGLEYGADVRVSADGDGTRYYPGENGELLYTRTTNRMVAIQTYDWYLDFLTSPDQFWKEDGEISFYDGQYHIKGIKAYTVSDYFAMRNTTPEAWFENLKQKGLNEGFETLEELYAANSDTVNAAYEHIKIEEIARFPRDTGTAWKSYRATGLSPNYYFFDRNLTYYCSYTYRGVHYQKCTLLLPKGYTNGEIVYVSGTGGSASMYVNVKTDQGYLRYLIYTVHGPDEVADITKLDQSEVETLLGWIEEERESGTPTPYNTLEGFLDAEQIALYQKASKIYPMFNGSSDVVNILHMDSHDPSDAYLSKQLSYQSGSVTYLSAEGAYQTYAALKELCLSVFTEAYWEELCGVGGEHPAFTERNGRLYYIDAAKGGTFGYDPEMYPDTYELVSYSDTEIHFYVIGYYKSSHVDPIYTVDSYAIPITMVRTADTWRISHFADPACVDTDDIEVQSGKIAFHSYWGKDTFEEILQMPIFYAQKEIVLANWLEDYELHIASYANIDMDGDSVKETVLQLARAQGGYQDFLILRKDGDTARAYHISQPQFSDLKADGTFTYDAIYHQSYISRMSFDKDVWAIKSLACRAIADDGSVSYVIEEQRVTSAEFEAFMSTQAQKAEPTWITVTDHTAESDWDTSTRAAFMELPITVGYETVTLKAWLDASDFQAIKYTVLALDGEDIAKELVLQLAYGTNEYAGYLILHREDGAIYAHMQSHRAFQDLKSDGSFSWSNSVSNHGYGKISFSKSSYTSYQLAYTTLIDGRQRYLISGKSVSEDAYSAFVTAQSQKTNVSWTNLPQ